MLPKENYDKVVQGVKLLLEGIGEDLTRDGLIDTPERVARMYSDVLDGNFAKFPRLTAFSNSASYGNMVIVKDVSFYAFCEHHLCAFTGHFAIGYIPNDKIVGLSKLIRVFRHFCKRPAVQERITRETVEALYTRLNAKGVICRVEAEHTCISFRGVQAPGSNTVTIAYKGAYESNAELRDEFLRQVSPQ